tara:strand:+ start:325 stop:1182 length:858 start_codon:yes stop_codon:yes gene_type:complete
MINNAHLKGSLKNKCASGIFKGQIRHRRFQPKSHAFTYPIFMLYLDLDELTDLFAKKWYCSFSGFNLVRFKRADFLSPEEPSLKKAVIQTVAVNASSDLAESICSVRALMHLRYLNVVFNPVVIYYCYDVEDKLVAIVAEITNTPWDERHAYILPIGDHHECNSKYSLKGKDKHQFEFQKCFHVSPFNPMNMDYRWVFSLPGEKLLVHMDNFMQSTENKVATEGDSKHFDATLVMNRHDFDKNLAKTLIQYPFMTVKVVIGIYWQALKLKLKGVPFHDHPEESKP